MNEDTDARTRFLLDPPEETGRKIHAVRHRSDWQESIRLAIRTLSHDNPQAATDIIRTAILAEQETKEFRKSAYEDILYRDRILAAWCLSECQTTDVALAETVKRALVEVVLEQNEYTGISSLRRRCIEALRDWSWALAIVVSILPPTIRDRKQSWDTRWSAADAAGQFGQATEPVVSSLIAVMQNREEDEGVRGAAARALGELGQPTDTIVSALLSIL